MIRAWILLSTLTFSVLFKLWPDYGGNISFPFSSKSLNTQSWIYFVMEHIIAIGVASCLLIEDNTPKGLFWLFFVVMCMDFIHYVMFFRDEGIGFNVLKVIIFGMPLLYLELRGLWTRYAQ